MLNPDHDNRGIDTMRHRRRMNPEGLMNVAKESGMTALEALGAAVVASGIVVGVSKIDYDATTPPQTAAMYRVGLGSAISVLAGAAMQFGSGWVEALGKVLIGLGVAVPAIAFITGKVQDAMLPATATPAQHAAALGGFGGSLGMAVQPAPAVAATAPSLGLMGWNSPYLNPSGFAADRYSYVPSGDIASTLVSPSYIPPAR